MFITKKALSRRTVLRGMGATLALPVLDAMAPALTAVQRSAAQAVPRLGFSTCQMDLPARVAPHW